MFISIYLNDIAVLAEDAIRAALADYKFKNPTAKTPTTG